jgi:hypothetical protein
MTVAMTHEPMTVAIRSYGNGVCVNTSISVDL